MAPTGPRPMLAVAAPLPAGDDWAFEFTWDGVRVLAECGPGRLRLFGRRGGEVTATYPELAGLPRVVPEVVLDGEIVVLTHRGPSFEALAERTRVADPVRARRLADAAPVTYLVFDVLRRDGQDLCPLPYQARRRLLTELVPDGPHWLVTPVFDDGAATLAASAAQRLEGVVAKRRGSPYRPGRRSADWVKVTHVHTDDLVVGGYRPGVRRPSALLVGEPGPAGLTYRGHVGAGISERDAGRLLPLLRAAHRERSPFADPVPAADARGALWVAPTVTVEVTHAGHTPAGRLRSPRLRRLHPPR